MPKKVKSNPVEEAAALEQDGDKFYKFDSSLKSIFQSGSSCTFRISGDVDDAEPSSDKEKKEVKDALKAPASKIPTWKERFFFTTSDPRLAEGVEFLTTPSHDVSAKKFDEVRKDLKGCIRNIMSKKKSLKFKKKFGRKKFRRNQNIKPKQS